VLRSPEFLAGATDSQFLERHPPATLCVSERRAETEQTHAVAAALAGACLRREQATVLHSLPAGWRNNPSGLQETVLLGRSGRLAIGYRLQQPQVQVNGEDVPIRVYAASPTQVDLELRGIRRRYDVSHLGGTWDVDSPLGHTALQEEPQQAAAVSPVGGSLVAPLPGRVIQVAVGAGARVEAGALLALIEAMKMEHPVLAPHAGVVREVLVSVGQEIEAGTLLLVLDPG